jgi:hypothetical protein
MTTPCLVWTGATDKDGYGIFQLPTKTVKAHRFAYAQAHGDPGRAMVRHRCDNPSCVEPTHLVAGTGKQNMGDMISRKRCAKRRTAGHYAAKMTQEKVDDLKRRKAAGESIYAIHAEYGIGYSQAKAICRGDRWKPNE